VGDPSRSAIDHFLATFCASSARPTHVQGGSRAAAPQPYVYWRLTTPVAYIIGLYANVANGGILDNPRHPGHRPQTDWLVEQLRDVRHRNKDNTPRKAVLLAVHYPPYSGATNFAQRGDPTLGLMKRLTATGIMALPSALTSRSRLPVCWSRHFRRAV